MMNTKTNHPLEMRTLHKDSHSIQKFGSIYPSGREISRQLEASDMLTYDGVCQVSESRLVIAIKTVCFEPNESL
jgi:hypothetical protein